ncbi:MAG: HAMP domain-containing histidine kinase [Clostridiales bacterium]|nr:HAMP domain-containing histidine kinase [Clostridiales bacterium]
MIKTAQRTFIAITMGILLIVFSVLYVGVNTLIRFAYERFVENTLDDSFDALIITNEPAPDKLIIHNDVVLSTASLDDEVIQQLLNNVKTQIRHSDFSNYGKFYFKVYYPPNTTDNVILIASDMSDTMQMMFHHFLYALFYMVIIYLLIFALVWQLSYKVFQPIKTNFEKQKRFISDASHELRTPLTIISANADVLKQNYEDNQWIDNIKSQTQRLDGLVADMLELAKLDEGQFKHVKEPFDLSESVTECALPFDAVAFEKKKELIFDIQPQINYVGDKNGLKKITSILIDNAIKHSSGLNVIKVTLKRDNSKIELSVYNTGSSIQPKDAKKIFERFYRGDSSRSRASGGSGLGLSIAKNIADYNKWKLSAESVYNESMTITLTIKSKIKDK